MSRWEDRRHSEVFAESCEIAALTNSAPILCGWHVSLLIGGRSDRQKKMIPQNNKMEAWGGGGLPWSVRDTSRWKQMLTRKQNHYRLHRLGQRNLQKTKSVWFTPWVALEQITWRFSIREWKPLMFGHCLLYTFSDYSWSMMAMAEHSVCGCHKKILSLAFSCVCVHACVCTHTSSRFFFTSSHCAAVLFGTHAVICSLPSDIAGCKLSWLDFSVTFLCNK